MQMTPGGERGGGGKIRTKRERRGRREKRRN